MFSIDVPGCLHTTMLCMNSILDEPALSRIITTFAKDLIAQDVMERANAIEEELWSAEIQVTRYELFRLDELAGYSNNFRNYTLVQGHMMLLLERVSEECGAIRSAIAEHVMSPMFRAVSSYPDRLIVPCIRLLYSLLRCTSTETIIDLSVNNRRRGLVDLALDAGLADVLLGSASMHHHRTQDAVSVGKVLWFFYMTLRDNPSIPHHAHTDQFESASIRSSMRALLQSPSSAVMNEFLPRNLGG